MSAVVERCPHVKYESDAHCAVPGCPNYFNACGRHSGWCQPRPVPCSQEVGT
jgi:hypothetical protein